VKHDRPGDWLWEEWDGFGYSPSRESAVVYATYGVMDPTDELVRRALASALQRDGVADSLGNGFRQLETAVVVQGFSGHIDDGFVRAACNADGLTELGDEVDDKVVTTWVELV
jgi:hypothetical protein